MSETKKRSLMMITASVFVVIAGLKLSSGLVIPFLLAMFIAIICHPVVQWLEKMKLPKSAAVISTLTLVLCMGTFFAQFISSSVKNLTANLPVYKAQLKEHLSGFEGIEVFGFSSSDLVSQFNPDVAISFGLNIVSGVGDVLGNAFLIILASVFMLLESDIFVKKFKHIAPSTKEYLQKSSAFISSVKNYMVMKTMISLLTGVLVAFMLWMLDVNHFALWGFLAFVFNFIPTVGSPLGSIPGICMAFIQHGSTTALIVLIAYLVINMVVGNILEPKVMGSGLGISTLAILISLVFWGYVFSYIGMILSPVLTMVIKIASDNSDDWHWLSVLLSDKPPKE